MPTCQNCYNKWSWRQTFKRSFTSDGMTCPYCEEKQYLTSRVRKGSTIIPFIMITLIMLSNFFLGPSFTINIRKGQYSEHYHLLTTKESLLFSDKGELDRYLFENYSVQYSY